MAMYISTAPPDPSYLTSSFACDQIPTEENGYVGQNSGGWCNEEASAAMAEADQTVDQATREELVISVLEAMAADHHHAAAVPVPGVATCGVRTSWTMRRLLATRSTT